MSLRCSVGTSSVLDGREAVGRAYYNALSALAGEEVRFALVLASYEYNVNKIISGLSASAGSVPTFGFSTAGQISDQGSETRSVVVALLAGEGIEARSGWAAEFEEQPASVLQKLLSELAIRENGSGLILTAVDGLSQVEEAVYQVLPIREHLLSGALVGCDIDTVSGFQLAGETGGAAGIALAYLSGDVQVGVGVAHGWSAVGNAFQVASNAPYHIHALNGQPTRDVYTQLFGSNGRDWGSPPLRDLIRLYPLGVKVLGTSELLVRSPVALESDGSLRVNAPVVDGSSAHVMIGSVDHAIETARSAAQMALDALEGSPPKLALIFADVAWAALMKARSGAHIMAVREVVGAEVPIAGGYTFGQVAQAGALGDVQILNQHMQVILLG